MAGAFQGLSGGVNVVEIAIKKLLGCFVSQNLPRQSVDTIGKQADFISSITRNALSFGDEPSQHTIVALVSALLPRRIWMGEIHIQLAIFQQR